MESEHKCADLRLQVSLLEREVERLRQDLNNVSRIALDAITEAKAIKLFLSSPPTFIGQNPQFNDQPQSSTPEGYTQEKAEKIVNDLFDGIDSVFGRPRGM